MTLRKCLLAAWNRPSASQCLEQSLRNSAMPQRLLQRGPRRHRVPWPHCLFMTLRNWLLAASNAPKVSQRLPHLFLWPSETAFWYLQTLLRPRSASDIFFYDPPQVFLAAWNPPSASQHLQQSLRASAMPQRLLQRDPRRHRVLWPHYLFITLRTWLLAVSNAPKVSQRLPYLWPHCLFITLRNWLLAASNAPKVSQHLPQFFSWPFETSSWHLETLLRPRSASGIFFYDPPQMPFGTLKPSFGLVAPPAVPQSLSNASEIASVWSQKAPCALVILSFYDPPKLTFGNFKPS